MTKDEEIEEFAVAALQLSQYLFMHLVDRNVIDPTEANQWLEQGIKLNSQGTEPHKKAAEIFEFLRQGLRSSGEPPPSLGNSRGNLYSITTTQAAIIALFRVVNRYVQFK